mmetsp:Transcript_14970/g.31937  ORF Transcript_14970/g.31937 Transcript_14970/m.31937 type:complete len:346 (-) Transcript_14970:124-1161(-)
MQMPIDHSRAWLDTHGARIEAHGAGLLLDAAVGPRAYWYGETAKLADFRTHGVSCYSSVDLIHWRYDGLALSGSVVRGLDGAAADGWIIERPKVIFNKKTKLFVMWFHLDGPSSGPRSDWSSYSSHAAGVAVSNVACGPYTFLHALRPAGLPSLDATLFLDDDDAAYHVQDVDHKNVAVLELTPDFTNATGRVVTTLRARREGLAMFKWKGRYFLATSRVSGWNPNPSDLYMRTQLWGSSDAWRHLTSPLHHKTSRYSQPAYVLTYRTQNGNDAAIWIADRWCTPVGTMCDLEWCPCLRNATYVWLPLHLTVDEESGSVSARVQWHERWRPEQPSRAYYSQAETA